MRRVCGDFVMVVAMLVVLLMASKEVCVMSQQGCDITELRPCLPAVTSPAQPTEICCSKLKSQTQCFCKYLKDPAFSHFATPEVTQKLTTACGIKIPKC